MSAKVFGEAVPMNLDKYITSDMAGAAPQRIIELFLEQVSREDLWRRKAEPSKVYKLEAIAMDIGTRGLRAILTTPNGIMYSMDREEFFEKFEEVTGA